MDRLERNSLEKLPPFDLEAEQAVLGAILLNHTAIHEALTVFSPVDFYRASHAKIFSALRDLEAQGETPDLILLRDELARRGQLEACGGPAYLAELVDQVPTAANIKHHAGIIHTKARLRRLLEASIEAACQCYEDKDDVREIAARLQGQVTQALHGDGQFDWLFQRRNGEIKISPRRFLHYLRRAGFGLLIVNNSLQAIRPSAAFRLAEGPRIVADCLMHGNLNYSIKQHVIADLEGANHTLALDVLLKQSSYFEEKFLTGLEHRAAITVNTPEIEDDEKTLNLCFANGVLETHKDRGHKFRPWAEISNDVVVWEDVIIRRPYRGKFASEPLTASAETPFKTFLTHLTASDYTDEEGHTKVIDNLAVAEYAIPYGLHKYLTNIGRKCIIVIDDRPRFMPDGRLGKGVFTKIFRYYHYYNPDLPPDNGTVVTEDGRSFSQQNRFKFQRMTPRTRLAILEDMDEKVRLTSFLSQITEGAVVEGKFQKSFAFAPNRAPKFIFTENSPNFGEGESETDRIILIPVGTYFREKTIKDVCGGLLYDSWDAEQWARCDNYIIELCRKYFETDPASVKTDTTVFNSHKLLLRLHHGLIDTLDHILHDRKAVVLADVIKGLKAMGYIGRFDQDLQTYEKLRECYHVTNRKDGRLGKKIGGRYVYGLWLLPNGMRPDLKQMELSFAESDNPKNDDPEK